jgi:transcriptional regulator with XRE-family HTH domain
VCRVPSDQPAWVLQQRQQVGRRIRTLREDLRLSQLDLAGRAGISRETMYRTELGTAAPTINVILRLADALKVPPDRLFRDE